MINRKARGLSKEQKVGILILIFSGFYIVWRIINSIEGEKYLFNYIIAGLMFAIGLFLIFFQTKEKKEGTKDCSDLSKEDSQSPPSSSEDEIIEKKITIESESIPLEQIEKELKNAKYIKEEKKEEKKEIEFVEIEDIIKKSNHAEGVKESLTLNIHPLTPPDFSESTNNLDYFYNNPILDKNRVSSEKEGEIPSSFSFEEKEK